MTVQFSEDMVSWYTVFDDCSVGVLRYHLRNDLMIFKHVCTYTCILGHCNIRVRNIHTISVPSTFNVASDGVSMTSLRIW